MNTARLVTQLRTRGHNMPRPSLSLAERVVYAADLVLALTIFGIFLMLLVAISAPFDGVELEAMPAPVHALSLSAVPAVVAPLAAARAIRRRSRWRWWLQLLPLLVLGGPAVIIAAVVA